MPRPLHEYLAAQLSDKGYDAKPSHSSSGDDIVQLGDNTGLMLFVEIYNQETGDHETVPLHDLEQKLGER